MNPLAYIKLNWVFKNWTLPKFTEVVNFVTWMTEDSQKILEKSYCKVVGGPADKLCKMCNSSHIFHMKILVGTKPN